MKAFGQLKNRASQAISHPPQQNNNDQSGGDQSLATLLSREQRAELSLLITQTTEEMRKDIIKVFDYRPPQPLVKPGEPEPFEDAGQAEKEEAIELSNSSTGQCKLDKEQGQEEIERESEKEEQKQEQEQEQEVVHAPDVQALRSAALSFFDSWAESVILRVGEAVNAREEAQPSSNGGTGRTNAASSKQAVKAEFRPSQRQQSVAKQLQAVYPPIDTPLASLGHVQRSAILNTILLLMLSLETYKSQSRSLLIRLAISLHITPAELTEMETNTAFGLLTAAAKMDASSQTAKGQERSATSRKWKIGVAGVAGAALIGITGGLAAPLLAAGVGTLMGGLGLGATAAASYLGALAGNAVLVGGLFGAYGARMTSQTMDKFSKEIEDFAFLPVRGSLKDSEEEQKKRRRLRLSIGITGWLTEEGQVVQPWRVFGDGGEGFALRWEVRALEELGSALINFIKSQAWSQLRKEVIKRTILAALYSAVMAPLAIRKAIRWVDSPFGIAKGRAFKAGQVLADALIERVQGERPVSLVGQSLGARVIYSCLLSLSQRKAFGLVENVVLMGAAVPSDEGAWRAMRAVVSGRLINVYSSQDYVLAFLYRASSAQLGVAGIQPIQRVSGVENFDMSQQVPGHLAYTQRTGRVLKVVGWEDIDDIELDKQEVLNRQLDQDAKEDEDEAKARHSTTDEDSKRTVSVHGAGVGIGIGTIELLDSQGNKHDQQDQHDDNYDHSYGHGTGSGTGNGTIQLLDNSEEEEDNKR